VIFWWQKNHHFAKKEVPSHIVNGTFWKNFQKNCHILREKVYEIAKIFGGFGQICSFLLLKSSYQTNKFW
jgi:hypothetical protein